MSELNIAVTGDLLVRITETREKGINFHMESKLKRVQYSYTPGRNLLRFYTSEGVGDRCASLQHPQKWELRSLELGGDGSRVVVEGVTSNTLTIYNHGLGNSLQLRNNNLATMYLNDEHPCNYDFSEQALPHESHHKLHPHSTVRMPNAGPPICISCYENEVTQLFEDCGHWCLCKNCSNSTPKCPLCRTGGAQIRVQQRSFNCSL